MVLLCYVALLRASEAITLEHRDFRVRDGWVAVLGRTKRGLEQAAKIMDPKVVQWLDIFMLQFHSTTPKGRIAGVSYNRLTYWLRRAARHLGFGALHWTSHGLRRGGASELCRRGANFKDIMLLGRWLGEHSAREYIRRGQVVLLAIRDDIPASAWARAHDLAVLGPSVWAQV